METNMNDEIREEYDWQWVWWDMDKDRPLYGEPTGTPWGEPIPTVQRRHIQIGTKLVHIGCSGTIIQKSHSMQRDDCTFLTKWWLECERCGKKFNESGYE